MDGEFCLLVGSSRQPLLHERSHPIVLKVYSIPVVACPWLRDTETAYIIDNFGSKIQGKRATSLDQQSKSYKKVVLWFVLIPFMRSTTSPARIAIPGEDHFLTMHSFSDALHLPSPSSHPQNAEINTIPPCHSLCLCQNMAHHSIYDHEYHTIQFEENGDEGWGLD